MRVAVLGAGNVGKTLGQAWVTAGHQVIFGVRDPAPKKAALKSSTPYRMAAVDTVAGAIAQGEVVVFAVPAKAVEPIVKANAAALDGFGAQDLDCPVKGHGQARRLQGVERLDDPKPPAGRALVPTRSATYLPLTATRFRRVAASVCR